MSPLKGKFINQWSEWAEGHWICWLILVSWQISIEILGRQQPENCTIYVTKVPAIILQIPNICNNTTHLQIISSTVRRLFWSKKNTVFFFYAPKICIFTAHISHHIVRSELEMKVCCFIWKIRSFINFTKPLQIHIN